MDRRVQTTAERHPQVLIYGYPMAHVKWCARVNCRKKTDVKVVMRGTPSLVPGRSLDNPTS